MASSRSDGRGRATTTKNSSQTSSPPSHLPFPHPREFNAMIAREDFKHLLWLPYNKLRTKELCMFFARLNAKPKFVSGWITGQACFDQSGGTKTRKDTVARFVELLDLMPHHVLAAGSPEAADEDAMPVSAVIQQLQEVLVENEFVSELELFRDKLYTFFVGAMDKDRDFFEVLCPSMFWNCWCYSYETRRCGKTYDHLTNMFNKNDLSRQNFYARCRREVDTLVALMELTYEKATDSESRLHVTSHGNLVIASILNASRLHSPFPRAGIMSKPFPDELASLTQAWFKRVFRLCMDSKILTTFQDVMDRLPLTVPNLPEFWVSSQALPLCKLLELMWKLLRTVKEREVLSVETKQNINVALRNVAYLLQQDVSVIDRVEIWVASKIDADILASVLKKETSSASQSRKQYPALSLLISQAVQTSMENCVLTDAKDSFPDFFKRLELFQSILLIAETPPSPASVVLWDAMTIRQCAALKSLETAVKACCTEADRLAILQKTQLDVIALFTHFGRVVVTFRALLNVMECLLAHEEVRRPFLLTGTNRIAGTMFKALEIGRIMATLEKSNPRFKLVQTESTLSFSERLTFFTPKFCALTALNDVLMEAAPGAVSLDTERMESLLGTCMFDLESSELPSLGLVAMARAVKDSRENWTKLQEFFKKRYGGAFSLSGVCSEMLAKAIRPDHDYFILFVEAITVFQYMAARNEDNGNLEPWLVIPEGPQEPPPQMRFPWRPVTVCLPCVSVWLEKEGVHEGNAQKLGRIFELLGNYIVNARAEPKGVPFAEDEKSYPGIHVHSLKMAHLAIQNCFKVSRDSLRKHMRVTVACIFTFANLTAVANRQTKLGYAFTVLRMIDTLLPMMESQVADGVEESAKQSMLLDEAAVLACKAILNTSRLMGDARESLPEFIEFCQESLRFCLASLKRAQRLPDKSPSSLVVYAALALHNLLRSAPSVKATMHKMGGAEILREWLAITSTEGGSEPLRDLMVGVFRTFQRNNPLVESSEEKNVKPKMSIKEAAIALGVPLTA